MLIDGLNESCNILYNSYCKVGNYSMSEIRFWNTVNGDLPHLSYIFLNPEPLGTEFVTVACSVTGVFLFI